MNRLLSSNDRHPQRIYFALWLLTLVAVLPEQPAHPSSNGSRLLHESCQAVASSASPAAPVFRLGTAGRPLGWTTAIGDLNVDGTPDLAIADRVAQRTNGYGFRIELSVSGQPTDAVTFESANDAVSISLSDVDADHDLDLVVRASLSNEPVGVWLNDGHGRFTSSDVRQLPAASSVRQALGIASPADDGVVDDVSSISPGACASAGVGAAPAPLSCHGFRSTRHPDLPSPRLQTTAGPRAPPVSLAVSLNFQETL